MEDMKYNDIQKHVNEHGVNGYLCLVCKYFNDRKSHTYKHYERIHMLNGRPCQKKRKYNNTVSEVAVKSYHQRTCSIGTHVVTECSHRARIREEGAERLLKKKMKQDPCSTVPWDRHDREKQNFEPAKRMHTSCKNQDPDAPRAQLVHGCPPSIEAKQSGNAFQQYVQSLRGSKRESDIVHDIFGISSANDKGSKHMDSCSKRANKKTFCVSTVKKKEHVVIYKSAVLSMMVVPDMQMVSMPAQKSAATSTVLTFGDSTIQWQQNEKLYEPQLPVFETATTLPYNTTG